LNMACEDLISNPEFSQQSRTAAIYGMASAVPDNSLVEEVSHMYLDSCYAMPPPPAGRTLSAEGRKMSLLPGQTLPSFLNASASPTYSEPYSQKESFRH
uniref:Transcription factor Tbx4 n=1 Tax=Gongylonema pulchrum TaxID=637853 RepID=A0A183D4Z8_9BILA